MPYASDYYEERINELELENARLEEKLATATMRVVELQADICNTLALLGERTEQRDAYRAALADLKPKK